MQRRNVAALETPIIGKTIQLNKLLLEKTRKIEKRLQHTYGEELLKKGALLFNFAMRELKGKDYIKRALETTEEIQSNVYLVHTLGGYNKRTTSILDEMCDDIIDQLCRISKSSNARINKSTDEIERA